MPKIYDNLEHNLANGLREALGKARRADFCVGYFNLRGWAAVCDQVQNFPSGNENFCRLIVGMPPPLDAANVRRLYGGGSEDNSTSAIIAKRREKLVGEFAEQLTIGCPTARDEKTLRLLSKQLQDGQLRVRFFARCPLHAKLYLAHRGSGKPIAGFAGSSNFTFSGLQGNVELNLGELDSDTTQKLAEWFDIRWQESKDADITASLLEVMENSWARKKTIPPYHIYLKTALHLSEDAERSVARFRIPNIFGEKLLTFQRDAVAMAAERLNREGGVIIGDVVGLGKTLVASAVAKIFQEDRFDNVLVICPANLVNMWKQYMREYEIFADTLSHAQVTQLSGMRRYKLVVIDESHNFRNRKGKRHICVRDYIRKNESRVILLTATPYNKEFADIASQLRLFLDPSADLGARPDNYIRDERGGGAEFMSRHPGVALSSLAAFEESEDVNDWRELMRRFMIRRTRSHIRAHHASRDEKGRDFLTFDDGKPYYFPERKPSTLSFEMGGDNDPYARLYSENVEEKIGELNLSRYGFAQKPYFPAAPDVSPNNEERKILDELGSISGKQLRGFTRVGLFKRLESSGETFLLSVRRHIVRDAAFLCALRAGRLPIGALSTELLGDDEDDGDDLFQRDTLPPVDAEKDDFMSAGEVLMNAMANDRHYKWLRADLFDKNKLERDLENDCESLLSILRLVPGGWNPDADEKLRALTELCRDTHSDENILVFTESRTTAKYLCRNLRECINGVEVAHGGTPDITALVARFSPRSNGAGDPGLHKIRVLVATDTLSEGQNLQDAHIVVNYDLPWAIIRLVQRAGRVDRIGQQSKEILCYSAFPADGVEKIINLRGRLRGRLRQNAELVGTDERFFDDDSQEDGGALLRDLHDGKDSAILEREDAESDPVSRAQAIWREAIRRDPSLEKTIAEMSDGCYSAKPSPDGKDGAIVYAQTGRGRHIVARVGGDGVLLSQSESDILDTLECEPSAKSAGFADRHHDLVEKTYARIHENEGNFGGQLGGPRATPNRVYFRLRPYLEHEQAREARQENLFGGEETQNLAAALQQILHWPLKASARDTLGRQLASGIPVGELANKVVQFYRNGELCEIADHEGEEKRPRIICSMGLV